MCARPNAFVQLDPNGRLLLAGDIWCSTGVSSKLRHLFFSDFFLSLNRSSTVIETNKGIRVHQVQTIVRQNDVSILRFIETF
jgi:hypothetical protein